MTERRPAMGSVPMISVVVATFNRAKTLRETLARLKAQTIAPESYEVIVVDDGSADDTHEVVAVAQRECRFALKYLQHPNHGPGYTQNRGIREARAPIVLLIADDIFLDPAALAAHLSCHQRHPEREVAILGRVLQSPALTQTVFLTQWDPWRLGSLPDDTPLPYHMFWACNISFQREFMLEHGMFREPMGRAGAAAHEDAELGHRLQQHGLRIFSGRDALGYHHHVETLEGTLRRSYQRGLNYHDFRQRVPHPEIDIAYRAYGLLSLAAAARDLRGARRQYLMPADRGLARLAARHVARLVLFNRATVNAVWLPLFAIAERRKWAAALARGSMYRGVIVYEFLRGCRDGNRLFGGASQPSAAA